MPGISDPSVDVVLPVYGASAETRRCIDSLYRYAGSSVARLIVYDDASDAETARMLDGLEYPRMQVEHASENRGFGHAVNRGMALARTRFVLVVNSDTEACDDFIRPLLETLQASARLAALAPAGNTFAGYDLSRYALRDGCVVTYNLYAYAFLIRRSVFQELGGFDTAFGRGYFEDSDLSRRLISVGWWLGIQPKARLHHAIHASFPDSAVRELLEHNSHIYHRRYPEARRRVLLLGGGGRLENLPEALTRELRALLESGGRIRWLCRRRADRLLALEMREQRGGLLRGVRLLRSRRDRDYRRITDLWIAPGARGVSVRVLSRYAHSLGVRTRDWH